MALARNNSRLFKVILLNLFKVSRLVPSFRHMFIFNDSLISVIVLSMWYWNRSNIKQFYFWIKWIIFSWNVYFHLSWHVSWNSQIKNACTWPKLYLHVSSGFWVRQTNTFYHAWKILKWCLKYQSIRTEKNDVSFNSKSNWALVNVKPVVL